MKFTKVFKTLALAILVMLATIITVAFAKINNDNLVESEQWVQHTKEVLLKTEQTLSTLKDVETGIRGYAITGDNNFLEPYNSGKSDITAYVIALKKLTIDNVPQQKRLDSLQQQVLTILATSNNIINIVNNKDSGSKLVTAIEQGKQQMDAIRATVVLIQNNENQLLQQRQNTNKEKQDTRDALLTLLFLIIVCSFLAFLFSFWFEVSIGKNGKLIQVIGKNSLLESKVEEIMNGITDPFFALDFKGNYTFINKAAKQKQGFDKLGLAGDNLFEVYPDYKVSTLGIEIQNAIKNKKPKNFEVFDTFFEKWQDVSINIIERGVTIHIKDASERKKNENVLFKTKQFLEETNEVASIGGWDLDTRTGTVYWSDITREIHEAAADYTPNLKSAINFYKEGDSRKKITEAVTICMESGVGWDLELQIITVKGNEKWVRAMGKPEMEDGECTRIYGTFQDITDKVLADIMSVNERTLLKTILNNIPVNVYIKDSYSKKIFVNNKEMEYMGVTDEAEILGKSDFDLYPMDTALLSVEEDQEVMKTSVAIINRETYNVKNDKTGSWFLTSKIPLLNEKKEITGIIGLSYDITDRKLFEEKIALGEQNFSTIFETVHKSLALLNPTDGSFVKVNNAIANLFGYTQDELIHISLQTLSHPDDRHKNIKSEAAKKMLDGDVETITTEKRYIRKNGDIINVNLFTTVLKDKKDNPVYVLLELTQLPS